MATAKNKLLILGLTVSFFFACKADKKHETPSFYFWKTEFNLSNLEKINLAHLQVRHLYVRMFDVVWDETLKEAKPIGILEDNGELQAFQVTPVIYIKNKVFKNLSAQQSKTLAGLVANQVSKMSTKYNFGYDEIQLDCDWTETTKTQFFTFLKSIKSLTNLTTSSTIRLHQIKYKKRSGVPPCDKGVLMFYNIGKINALQNRNSIFNTVDAEKYSSYINSYPIPLSAALPIYSWGIHCRAGKVKQILPRREYVDFSNNAYFEIDTPFVRVKEAIVFKGIAFEKNDYIKIEAINSETCFKAAQILQKNAPENGYEDVIFFDIDAHSMNHFNHEKITDIYNLLP
jgi:hypothetical protein